MVGGYSNIRRSTIKKPGLLVWTGPSKTSSEVNANAGLLSTRPG